MKFSLLTSAFVIAGLAICSSADAKPKQGSNVTSKPNQAANLVTKTATISSQWNFVSDTAINNDPGLKVTDPECKKINPLQYLNNPETFFQSCSATNNPNYQDYEPIDYLKVPRLDLGLSVTVSNF
ncbi:hypothetical protein [Sphaerospermopsis sp. LEGE 08334]|uniref:hypothetical protein n=1 Tax=Sphaerospermopsis sp. LEGE 08334 TaxID=1828651 RepID=UPI00188173D3|nr:hypothetical protein [Sphaerospermopsis sp. LEGE 08334]MBE9057882.1 hypothetical protein [Sphaerospermopsis sp. LEGE 08334]